MSSAITRLADRLRDADCVTPELFAGVIREVGLRLRAVRRTKDFVRFQELIQSGAWIDAALALLALEAPQWQLRRIVHDAGDWHCTLSRVRQLPDWLDQPAEGRHRDLCLAILSALVSIKSDVVPAAEDALAKPFRIDQPLDTLLCGDNFI